MKKTQSKKTIKISKATEKKIAKEMTNELVESIMKMIKASTKKNK